MIVIHNHFHNKMRDAMKTAIEANPAAKPFYIGVWAHAKNISFNEAERELER